jgi:hypothetical protein
MNIPLMFNISNETPIIQKTSKKKSVRDIKKNRFIGIIQIPVFSLNKSKITRYDYVFIFENPSNNFSRNYYNSNFITHFQIYDSELNKLALGSNRLRTLITFDEINTLHYMSKYIDSMKEYRTYFYRDPYIPHFIFISTMPNLNDQNVYPNYYLEKVYLDEWKEQGYRKQFIFYTDATKISVQQKLKIANKIQDFNDENGNRQYILITSDFLDP